MTLHEAIEALLIEKNQPMRPVDIAAEINRRGWYRRKDGSPLPSSQIGARTKNYPHLFTKMDGLVHRATWVRQA